MNNCFYCIDIIAYHCRYISRYLDKIFIFAKSKNLTLYLTLLYPLLSFSCLYYPLLDQASSLYISSSLLDQVSCLWSLVHFQIKSLVSGLLSTFISSLQSLVSCPLLDQVSSPWSLVHFQNNSLVSGLLSPFRSSLQSLVSCLLLDQVSSLWSLLHFYIKSLIIGLFFTFR